MFLTGSLNYSRRDILAIRSNRLRAIASHGYASKSDNTSSGSLKSLRPTVSEIQKKRLSLRNVKLALEALHGDGMVMIEDAIPNLDQIDRASRFFSF
jgi:hypothetical protein